MPIHEYLCSQCGAISEVIVFSPSEPVRCPKCQGQEMQKLLSASSSASGPKNGARIAGAGDTGCCGSNPVRQQCVPGSCCGKAH